MNIIHLMFGGTISGFVPLSEPLLGDIGMKGWGFYFLTTYILPCKFGFQGEVFTLCCLGNRHEVKTSVHFIRSFNVISFIPNIQDKGIPTLVFTIQVYRMLMCKTVDVAPTYLARGCLQCLHAILVSQQLQSWFSWWISHNVAAQLYAQVLYQEGLTVCVEDRCISVDVILSTNTVLLHVEWPLGRL